jgi:hypothetical protein
LASASPESACSACGAAFHCGARDRDPCWCAALPPLAPVAGRNCLCRDCLKKEIEKESAKERT